MNKIHVFPTSMGYFEQATRIDRRLALESGFLANLSKTISAVVPELMDSTREFLANRQFAPTDNGNLKGRTPFLSMMDKVDYIHTTKLSIRVPEGFAGNLIDYVNLLKASAVHASEVVDQVLTPYNTFLSGIISSHEVRLDSRNRMPALAKRDVAREDLNASIGKQFRIGSTAIKTDLGKVVKRNADWEAIVINLPKVSQAFNGLTNKVVQESVDDCLGLLNAVKTAAQSGELDNTSGQMLKYLSECTLSVAREVEFYSITSYRIHLMNEALDETIELLTNALKD